MKKQSKKLKLKRETIRTLTPTELGSVAGGGSTKLNTTSVTVSL